MKANRQQTETLTLNRLAAAFDALDAITRRQYHLLNRLADSVPEAVLAVMDETDREFMPVLAQRAESVLRREAIK